MFLKKLLAGILTTALVATSIPATLVPAQTAKAADTDTTPTETTIKKTEVSNPILGYDTNGDLIYGGDPSVLVDGDTVYLYTGRDTSTSEDYYMPEWQCYSTKDLKNWTLEGTIMKADKTSITWAKTGTDAWAGQVEKYNNKYYFYYCTWDSTSGGQQSIGVAVSDSPTKGFKDIGTPLIKGTVTTSETSTYNDIDPTVWVETVDGVEHRYLAWGNGKYFICELNEDMTSVKDLNSDGKITFGKSSSTADIIEKTTPSSYTEAPWLYRRKDTNGNPTGKYYLFYAYGWREQMAYATTDNLLTGNWTYQGILMPPTATSNTNHMAVFDFKGKTYFIYHNGSLPGGSGFRRTACITELVFDSDGSIKPIAETAIGITGDTPYTIYSGYGDIISHEAFTNSSADSTYPYKDISVGSYLESETEDTEWAIVQGKADTTNEAYVSIQSENKPGLYLTVNDDDTVTLAQDYKYSSSGGKIVADSDTAKAQTFRTVTGLNGDENATSFESVSKSGMYLTLSGGSLALTDGSNKTAASFYLNKAPNTDTDTEEPGTGTDTSIKSLSINGTNVTASDASYKAQVPYETSIAKIKYEMNDEDGYVVYNGKKATSNDTIFLPISSKTTTATITAYASDGTTKKNYTISVERSNPTNAETIYNTDLVKTFTFENTTDDAVAVLKGLSPTAVSNPAYSYVAGIGGSKAIQLSGSYGLKLCDTTNIGSSYSISFWMKPDSLGGDVDPVLAGGTFTTQYWFNVTASGRGIWSYGTSGYINSDSPSSYFTVDEWQHVVLTVDGTKSGTTSGTSLAKLYLNGELVQTGQVASNILGKSGAALYFGVNGWDAYFKGAVDEIAIFNSVLTDNQILSLAYEMTDVTAISNNVDPNKKTESPTPTPGTNNASSTASTQTTNTSASASATSTVKKSVTKVVITKKGSSKAIKKTVTIKKGKKLKLAAKVTVKGGASKKVTWKSSKKKVATVSSKGVVTGKKKGTAKITATSKANKKKKCTIKVKVK